MTHPETTLPEELLEENYQYPPELFHDKDETMTLRFDGSEEIQIPVPVTVSERPVLMARFAVLKALHLTASEDRLLKIARLEQEPTFMRGACKIKQSYVSGQLEKGDIELKADELGVYEIVFPLDPNEMRKAAEAEQQIEEGRVLATA